MKVPNIFRSKTDFGYWDKYWKRIRQIPPSDVYLYYGRVIPMKEVDRCLNKVSFESAIEEKISTFKNFIKNLFIKKDKEID